MRFLKKEPKDLTEEQIQQSLANMGAPTHKGSRKSKFSGFSNYAKEVTTKTKKDYNKPESVATAAQMKQKNDRIVAAANPYAAAAAAKTSGNPYADVPSGNPYGGNAYGSNPYQNNSSQTSSQTPYAAVSSNGDNYGGGDQGARIGASQGRSREPIPSGNPYASVSSSNPYGGSGYTGGPQHFESAGDVDPESARNELFGATRQNTVNGRSAMGSAPRHARASVTTLDELNAAPDGNDEEDELLQRPSDLQPVSEAAEYDGLEGQEYEGQINSEDEDVEEIKQQIRFTKKESAQSTRNTLQMAADAEAAGRNTLGMLGSQGERVSNTERTLALAESQANIAEQQSQELLRLNRSIFIPNVSNPFTSKRRMQEREAKIKSEHLQEQVMRERRRQMAFESEQRVINGLSPRTESETAAKYRQHRGKGTEERQRVQFEADSEDEELEDEIDANLEGISQAATRLKNLGLSMNEEIDSQNRRLDRIAEQTDNLDVGVHLSSARLATIR